MYRQISVDPALRSKMVRRSKTLVVLVVAALTAGLVADPTRAEATTPVTAIAAANGISWVTPIERAADVRFANSSTSTSASTVITINDASAPTSYPFQFQLPPGADLVPTGDGGFDVVNQSSGVGVATAHIDVPWAHDANGAALRTWFTVDGNSLVQHIDPTNAAFPVTADPKITWGWVTGTIYFNKRETAEVAVWGGFAGFWAGFLPSWGKVLGAYAAWLTTVAGIASAQGRCLKIKLPLPYPYTYSGGYCT